MIILFKYLVVSFGVRKYEKAFNGLQISLKNLDCYACQSNFNYSSDEDMLCLNSVARKLLSTYYFHSTNPN